MSKSSDALNAMFAADPAAIYSLVSNHVSCNDELSDDQFAVTGLFSGLHGSHRCVGLMGFVNAVLSANGLPLVASVWEDSDEPGKGPKFCGFAEYKPNGD